MQLQSFRWCDSVMLKQLTEFLRVGRPKKSITITGVILKYIYIAPLTSKNSPLAGQCLDIVLCAFSGTTPNRWCIFHGLLWNTTSWEQPNLLKITKPLLSGDVLQLLTFPRDLKRWVQASQTTLLMHLQEKEESVIRLLLTLLCPFFFYY